MQAILERLLAACNKHGLVMQVPAVAAQVMELVSVGDPDAPTLMGQIKTIDVFKVYPAEARVQSTRATPGAWWVWGVPCNVVPRTTLRQLVTEAQQFFPQTQVSSHGYSNKFLINVLGSPGIMEFQTYSMSGKPQAWGLKMSNYTRSIS